LLTRSSFSTKPTILLFKVGHEEADFYVLSTEIIEVSDTFKDRFNNGQLDDARNGGAHLPGTHADIFAHFVEWSKLCRLPDTPQCSRIHLLLELYIFATTYRVRQLARDIMKRLSTPHYLRQCFPAHLIARAYKMLPPGDVLLKHIVEVFVDIGNPLALSEKEQALLLAEFLFQIVTDALPKAQHGKWSGTRMWFD
jgi:hypothetical protein